MSLQFYPVVLFIAFPVAIAQLLSTLGGPFTSLALGIASGFAVLLPNMIAAPASFSRWVIPGTLFVASVAGLAVPLSAGSWHWLAGPLAAFGSALLIDTLRSGSRKRCALCNRRLGSCIAFNCPRCGMLVCDQSCWNFEHLRCRLCLQNEVPVFTPDSRWWDRQFGPRFMEGQCQLCLEHASDSDLRTCRHCGRPQCRHCWDMMNGQCSRCRWTIEDLPAALDAYVNGRPAESGRV